MPATASPACWVDDGAPAAAGGQDGAAHGIWLECGAALPDELWSAMCGRAPWAGPGWAEDEPPGRTPRTSCTPGVPGTPDVPGTPGNGDLGAVAEVPLAAGFGQGGALDGLAPGPELALLLPGAADLGGLGDDELTGALRGRRRLSSWAAAMEHAAVAELAGRRIAQARSAGACLSEAERFAAAEVAAALTLTRCAAEGLVGRALSLGDLPGTAGALASGVIDVPKALVIVTGVAGLGDELARRVEANVLPKAAAQTSGELRQAVARAVAAADPAGAQCRHDQAVKAARVERWAEAAGTGALAGRDLPAADALAADNRINALAAALRADGAAGGMDFLRAQVFAGLLLGRPVAAPADAPAPAPAADAPAADAPAPVPAAGTGDIPGLAATDDPVPDQVPAVGPAPDAPAPGGDSATGHGGDLGGATDCGAAAGGAGDSAAGSAAVSGSGYAGGAGLVSGAPARLARVAAGPAPPPGLVGPPGGWGHLTGSVNLTLPLAALLGEGGAPAEVAGFGPVPAAAAAQLAAAAWQSPAMRWCITVTDAAGRAAGHGCATSSPAAAAAARGPGAAVGGGPGGASGGWAFQVTVAALATGDCDHHRETPGYVPPKSLRHLIEIRDQTCSFPGCRRPARQCDLDHSVAYARGGRSCECNLAPLCRLHHKIKQARGWKLEQPEPGVLQWTAPSGWRYTVTPRGHPT